MAQQQPRIDFDDFAENLEKVFEHIRDRNQPVYVEHNGETYRVEKETSGDIWQDYDADRVQKALRATAGMLKDVDIDALIADIEAQREQGPGRFLMGSASDSGRST